MWRTWVGLWSHEERPTVLAIVRILLSLVVLSDFLTLDHLGLTEVLFTPQEVGGFPDVADRVPVPELYRWFTPDPSVARAAWWGVVGAIGAFGLGFLTPLSGAVFVLLSAQLAQVLPLGDRGIDMMIRNVVCILCLSGCGRVWGVDARLFGRLDRAPAWPRHLLVLQIAAMYFLAGIQKTALSWTPLGGYSALFLVLQDPSIARHDFGWLREVYPLTQLASFATVCFEYTACLVPLVYWFRVTRTRPGRLRAWFNTHRPLRAWLVVGVLLHLGIAATMALGIFPWAMLALYPAFFHPDALHAGRRGAATGALSAAP